MTTYDYENAYVTFKWLVARAAEWTLDYRELGRQARYVFDAIDRLHKYNEDDHSIPMTPSEQRQIVDCLRNIHWAACQTPYNRIVLASEALNILETLNALFIKEGLAPVTELNK